MAITDWYSRRVLAWRQSNTLESSFCVEALQEALQRFPKPTIFNTDQGAGARRGELLIARTVRD